jgi:hypothetical protein
MRCEILKYILMSIVLRWDINATTTLWALQPMMNFFLQFLNHIDSRYDSLGGGSARRKAANYTGQHKHRINANIHASSGIRTHNPSALDRAATVIG